MMEENVTATLTIELDTPELERTSDLLHELLPFRGRDERFFGLEMGPPLSASEIDFKTNTAFPIGHLSREARDVLAAHLNLPALGSLRNWESVAASLGMDSDRIMGIRSQPSPTERLLEWAEKKPCALLIQALVYANRVDTLLSLSDRLLRDVAASAYAPRAKTTSISTTKVKTDKLPPPSPSTSKEEEARDVILVTHEEAGDKAKIKEFRWLMKNLRQKSELCKRRLVDVEDVARMDEPLAALESAFERARHVLLVVNADYAALLAAANRGDVLDELQKLKCYLHRRMDSEYYNGHARNQRFRVVLPQYANLSDRPAGWAQSTLCYAFPADSNALFARLFKDDDDRLVTL